MKKLCILLVLCLLLCASACNSQTSSTQPAATAQVAATPKLPENPTVTSAKATLVDNDYCTILVSDIQPEAPEGFTVYVDLVNKSGDLFVFSLLSATTNSVVNDVTFAKEVAANETVTETIIFRDKGLATRLGYFTDISLTFLVTDPNTWVTESIANGTYHIYPYGQQYAAPYQRPAESADRVLAQTEQVAAIVTGYEEDPEQGFVAKLYLVNKTKNTVEFRAEDVLVNGIMIDPNFSLEIEPGCSAFANMQWSSDALQEKNIAQVDSIEMNLLAYNCNSHQVETYANISVSLEP